MRLVEYTAAKFDARQVPHVELEQANTTLTKGETCMKRISFVAALCTLILICGLQAAAQNHVIINATGFSYIAGMPDYTQGKGLVAGGSATPVDGFANLAVPQGAVITGFRMCARDFASDQNVSADLWRKTVNPINSTFTAPQRMAHVQTSVSGAHDARQCLK